MRMNRAPAPFTTTACWRPPDSQRGLRSRTPRPWRPRPTRATRSTPTPNRSQLGVRTAATSPPLRTGSVEVAATSRSPQMRAVCCTRGSSGVSALSTMNTNRSRPVPGLPAEHSFYSLGASSRFGFRATGGGLSGRRPCGPQHRNYVPMFCMFWADIRS